MAKKRTVCPGYTKRMFRAAQNAHRLPLPLALALAVHQEINMALKKRQAEIAR